MPGGYNGGGSVIGNSGVNHINASGGGATHIAKVSGLLSTLENNVDSILIVAGAGGGARNQENHSTAARWGNGGSGGGYIGGGAVSNFNTTTTGYHISTINAGTQISGYAFGMGESVSSNSGGGAGYFGGFGGSSTESYDGLALEYSGSGSGGSGYIGNSLLTNKVMYGYNVTESSDESTKTVSTTNYSATAIANYAKSGNGYATVSLVSTPYLADLKINGQDIGFEPETLEYNVVVDKTVEEVGINYTKGSSDQIVETSTDFKLTEEVNTKYVTVTLEDGTVTTYTINITFNDADYPYLSDITLNGESIENFESDVLEYTVCVENTIQTVVLEGIKGASYQEITYPDGEDLIGVVTTKHIEVATLGETTVTYTINIEYSDPRLKSIEIENGTLSQTFDSNKYEYNVVASSDYDYININAIPIASLTTVDGNGIHEIEVGTTDIVLTTTDYNNTNATYTLHVTRLPSSKYQLEDIIIDGESLEGFDKETLYYEVNVPLDKTNFTIDVVKEIDGEEVILPTDLSINSGENKKEIIVTSEDKKYTTTYVINFIKEHSSKLRSLKFGDYDFNVEFDPEKYEYYMSVPSNVMSVSAEYVAYDEEAVVKITGNGYIKNSSTIKVNVTEQNSEPTEYTIIVLKETATDEEETTKFAYTGNIQTFTAPYTGTYKLETWGAQGGSISGYTGGYGGYSSGETYLNKGEVLYVVVGGSGSGATTWRRVLAWRV